MIALLGEGIRAIWFPCTLAILVPGLIAVLVGSPRLHAAVTSYVLTAGVATTLRFANIGFDVLEPARTPLAALAVVSALVMIWLKGHYSIWAIPVGSALMAVSAVWWWEPCVGEHFGNLLGALPGAPRQNLAGSMAYVAGQTLPISMLAALTAVWPRIGDAMSSSIGRLIAMGLGSAMALSMIAGRYDDLLGWLTQYSSF